MTNEEAEAVDTVVEGKLFVCDHEARVLFDSGSTHSFIAPHFTMTIGSRPEQLLVVIRIVTLVGRRVVCDMVYL